MRATLRSFARRLTPLSALALLMLLALTLGVGASPALAAGATGAAGSAGVIAGVAENGTHGNAPVAGQQVTLQLTIGTSAQDIASATTDAQGRFSFTGIDVSESSLLGGSYAVYTRFQGGVFSSGAINLSVNQTQTVTLMVYDATQDSANLSVSVATVLVREPDITHGLVGIGEFITVRNSGMTAFVGSFPANGANGAMPSLLRFSLPASAQNVTTGVGFFNTSAIQIDSGFAAAATVPPGQTQFAFAYDLPYTGTTLTIPFKAEYPTAQVVTLVSPNMLVRATSGVSAQGIVTAFGAHYQVYTANNVAADGQVSVNLYDLPQPGEPQDLNSGHLLWLGVALLALLALLLALYVWRGALAAALGLIPAATTDAGLSVAATGAVAAEDGRAAERERLLRQLLALERSRASGAISEAQFKRDDAALRGRLRALLAGDAPVANPAAATEAPGVAAVVDAAPTSSGGKR